MGWIEKRNPTIGLVPQLNPFSISFSSSFLVQDECRLYEPTTSHCILFENIKKPHSTWNAAILRIGKMAKVTALPHASIIWIEC